MKSSGLLLLLASALAAAGRHLDVITFNDDHAWSPDPARVAPRVRWSGQPFLVTAC